MKRILSLVILGLLVAGSASAVKSDFPQPKALEPDVTFWKRIYSEVGTDGGLIHDTHDLGLVYEVVKFPSRYGADRHTENRKRYYQGILRSLAAGKRSGLSSDEKRVLALFGRNPTSARFRLAAERLRFQLGQADKFRAGIIRSGAYKDHILGVLRDMNLPLEIANLPHVESSFTPNIYSRVGAAGLWQFTNATGRRFMQVDHVVDERLDPYRASIAAARLLEQNYRVTGTWPLAITAYNHGASGMRRAAQQLGTKDIARIVREYRSPTFGFASRNFYVEFLAATHVATNYRDHFGELTLDRPIDFESVTLPYYARSRDLANSLGVDLAVLEKANPALRPGVWKGANFVPKGFKLRVPSSALDRPLEQALAAVPNANRYAAQSAGGSYVVRRGDTLSKIARRHGLSTRQLASMNGLRSANNIRVGQRLKLPSRQTLAPVAPEPRETVVASAPRAAQTAPEKASEAAPKPLAEVASAAIPAAGPAAGPAARPAAPQAPAPPRAEANAAAAAGPQAVAATRDSVTETTTYTVRRGDNLSRIARAHGVSVAELSATNGLGRKGLIRPGQRLEIVKPASDSREVAEQRPPQAPAAVASAASPANAPDVAEALAAKEESATDPSPGLLADPSDYSIGRDRTIVVQANETLSHYAEWLGVRASRLRQLNGLRYGEPVVLQQKIRLDFANVPPADFERIRTEYHRELQEEFFAEWEIEGTSVHKVGPGDSIWSLSTRRFAVPIWLLRQYNPDVDLDTLSAGTPITVPKLRQRGADTSARERDRSDRTASAG